MSHGFHKKPKENVQSFYSCKCKESLDEYHGCSQGRTDNGWDEVKRDVCWSLNWVSIVMLIVFLFNYLWSKSNNLVKTLELLHYPPTEENVVIPHWKKCILYSISYMTWIINVTHYTTKYVTHRRGNRRYHAPLIQTLFRPFKSI